MHAGQLHLSVAEAAGVIARQFPEWADRPVRPVSSHGTVNLLFRVGDDLVARFPLEPRDIDVKRAWLEREQVAARLLFERLPVPTPEVCRARRARRRLPAAVGGAPLVAGDSCVRRRRGRQH